MMTFKMTSNKIDCVKTWRSDDGFFQITKRANTGYVVKQLSLFNIMGETLGEYETLEAAIASV